MGDEDEDDQSSESDDPTEADSSGGQDQSTDDSSSNESESDQTSGDREQSATPPTQLVAQLTGEEGLYRDEFGQSVAVSGDGRTVIVGAIEGADPENRSFAIGAAYVFDRSGDEWQETARLTADDGDNDDEFGWSVAMADDGQTAIIGAPGDRISNDWYAGSAYIFERDKSGWQQAAKLTADDGDRDDNFGNSVALSGDGSTAIVGAVLDEDPHGESAGSAYVFEQSGGWQQTTKLVAEDGNERDSFGASVALSGDGGIAAIGAVGDETSNGALTGSAYVFEQSDNWQQTTKLTAEDGESWERLGSSITMSATGETVIIGSSRDQDPAGDNTGSAYVFEQNGDWQQTAKLSADDGDSHDYFGNSIAVSSEGRTVIVGARGDDSADAEDTGSAYVFEHTETGWQQAAKHTIDDGDRGDSFGLSVAMSGDGGTAVVGGDWHHDEIQSAYIFE
jgi:hypothetical protein